jgi:recombination associated protein RdgC
MSSAMGWYSPFNDPDSVLVHANQGAVLFAIRLEDKLLPASVIRESLDEKIKQMEVAEDRRISSQEKSRLRTEITASLLPKAFCKRELLMGYIDPVLNLLIVNTQSAVKFGLFQKLLHQSLPQLKLSALPLRQLNYLMAEWLLHPELLSEAFEVADACVMQNPEKSASTVRCQNQSVLSEGVYSFIKAGFKISQIRLIWREQLAFTLRADGVVQQIKFLDMIQDMREEVEAQSQTEQLDADFFIMTQTFREFFQDLLALIADKNIFSFEKNTNESTEIVVEPIYS